MSTPSIQTLITQAQQVLNLKSSNEIRATLAAVLANANVGTPLNPNLTTQQLWDEFYEIVRQPSDDIMSIITDQMMRMVFSPPAPGGAGADKQVIFNDGGVLAGDAGLTYNKATDALTITGDLTVRTTGLTVNSSGVGVGTSSQSSFLGNSPKKLVIGDGTQTPALTLYGGTANVSGIYYAKGTVGNEAYRGFIEYNHAVDALTVGISGSTAMTLNSTGLGIGVSPSQRLHVKLDQNAYTFSRIDNQNVSSGAYAALMLAASGNSWGIGVGSAAANSNALDFFLDAGGANSVKMTLNSTGNLVFPTGKGIDFTADGNAAGMTSELLNDYEEGTWTIGLTFGGGTTGLTTSSNAGRYTKVGRQVTVSGYLALSNKGSSVGAAVINGLPFTIGAPNAAYSAASLRLASISYTGAFQAFGAVNGTTIGLEQISTLGAVLSLTDVNFANNSEIIFSLTYSV